MNTQPFGQTDQMIELSCGYFYKLIVLFLMGLAKHTQITWVNLQYLYDILRKKLGVKLGT